MLFHVHGPPIRLRALACALAVTVSALVLSGCVSAVTPDPTTAGAAEAVESDSTGSETADASQAPTDNYEDQQVVALGGRAKEAGIPSESAMQPAAGDGQPAALTMQATGLNATSSSIFATAPGAMSAQPITQGAQAGASLPPSGSRRGASPISNSLFQAAPSSDPAELPLEGASNTVEPPATKFAETGGTARVAGPLTTAAADAGTAQAIAGVDPSDKIPAKDENASDTLTFAGLFAAKKKSRHSFNSDRLGKVSGKKTLNRALPQEVAALGYMALPGVRTTSMFATVDDAEPGHDDESPAVEVASLSGLARLAPSGFWLQTEKVETGCFKPELMQVLKSVEAHYGQKIMVTSGLRDLSHNRRAGGRPRSLHTTCDAADIQVPGVSKWELATYLRTIPGRGGVGTYCHTQSVHIDTGVPRDWNWRCRRRKS